MFVRFKNRETGNATLDTISRKPLERYLWDSGVDLPFNAECEYPTSSKYPPKRKNGSGCVSDNAGGSLWKEVETRRVNRWRLREYPSAYGSALPVAC